jgi:protein KRI1
MFSSDEDGDKPRKLELDAPGEDGFQVNKQFADKYEHN